MQTVQVPKKEYEALKKKAYLYEKIFRCLPERVFGIEEYTKARMKEFESTDTIDPKTTKRIQQLLDS